MTDYTTLSDDELIDSLLRLDAYANDAAVEIRKAKEELLHRKRNVIDAAYKAKDEPFGSVHVPTGAYKVTIATAKRVEWDQEQLLRLEATIRDEWKSDPAEFIDRKLSVREGKYKAWPSDLRAAFEPARLVKAGSPTITIQPKE